MYQVTFFFVVGAMLTALNLVNNLMGDSGTMITFRSAVLNGTVVVIGLLAWLTFTVTRAEASTVFVRVEAEWHQMTSVLIILAAVLTLNISLWWLSLGIGAPLLVVVMRWFAKERLAYDYDDGMEVALAPITAGFVLCSLLVGVQYGSPAGAHVGTIIMLVSITLVFSYVFGWLLKNDAQRRFQERQQAPAVSPTTSRDYRPGNNVDVSA